MLLDRSADRQIACRRRGDAGQFVSVRTQNVGDDSLHAFKRDKPSFLARGAKFDFFGPGGCDAFRLFGLRGSAVLTS